MKIFILLFMLFSIVESNSSIIPNFAFNDEKILELDNILDANFTPDGNQIVLGTTKGLFFLDRQTLKINQQLTIPNIWFIKWPDDASFLIVGIKENQKQYNASDRSWYAVYNVKNNKIIVTIKDDIKWIMGYVRRWNESDPLSIVLYHTNSINISPDSKIIIYLSNSNELTGFDMESNSEKWRITIPNENLYATGFFDDNTIWISTESGKIFSLNFESSNLHQISVFADSYINRYQDKINPVAIQISKDKKYIIAKYGIFGGDFFFERYGLYDLETGKLIMTLGQSGLEDIFPPKFYFAENNKYIYSAIYGSGEYQYHFSKTEILTQNQTEYAKMYSDYLYEPTLLFHDIFLDRKTIQYCYLYFYDNIYSVNLNGNGVIYPQTKPYMDMVINSKKNNIVLYYNKEIAIETSYDHSNNHTLHCSLIDYIISYPLAITNNGEWLFASNDEYNSGTGRIFDFHNMNPYTNVNYNPEGRSYSTSFSLDDSKLLLARSNGLWVWNPNTGAVLNQFPAPENGFRAAQFTSDANEVITGGGDGSVKEWDLNTNKDREIVNLKKPISFVSFMNKESNVLIVDASGEVFILDRASGNELYSTKTKNPVISQDDVALANSEKFLVVENQVLDVEKKKWINIFGNYEPGNTKIVQVRISPADDWVAVRTENGIVRVWDKDRVFIENADIKEYRQY